MPKLEFPQYFMYEAKAVKYVLIDKTYGQFETKDGIPIPAVKVLENGTPITKEEFDKYTQ